VPIRQRSAWRRRRLRAGSVHRSARRDSGDAGRGGGRHHQQLLHAGRRVGEANRAFSPPRRSRWQGQAARRRAAPCGRKAARAA
jgi:hypothetical protein